MVEGLLYLLFFSLGLGIPFVVSALFLSSLLPLFDRIKRRTRVVMMISGVLLVVMRSLMVAGVFGLIRLG